MNTSCKDRLNAIGLQMPKLLLPGSDTDLSKWAVVACDQYTAAPEYWREVETLVKDSPSTLNLIFPECYLEEDGKEKRIADIRSSMEEYLDSGILTEYASGLQVLRREFDGRPARTGMLMCIDLDAYDYRPNSTSPIRPTEGTIIDRIPPRKAIRCEATLELPHILVLINDPQRTIIEPVFDILAAEEPLYSTQLMKNGGKVCAYRSEDSALIESTTAAFEKLANSKLPDPRYQSEHPFFIAIGDGNHSLATAKEVWEDMKAIIPNDQTRDHPARYALVEVVNIYDEGILFEPIHRLFFDICADNFLEYLSGERGATIHQVTDLGQALSEAEANGKWVSAGYVSGNRKGIVEFPGQDPLMTAKVIQEAIDGYPSLEGTSLDFIHDFETVINLGAQPGNLGIVMPAISKASFFPYLQENGTYPRKSFALGESNEKRYYMEARRIR
ncbi:MAG: DUF1015 domain-containing protein [Spirochaetales bacterium]|jgi:hypothetical protein|nr:DUF1015 domain-containing protein [Spirochaetales bacterium]